MADLGRRRPTGGEVMVAAAILEASDDPRSGLLLEQFRRAHLARGGFFQQLEGRADHRWPRRWVVDTHELTTAATNALRLPAETQPDAFAAWLGVPLARSAGVIVHAPAAASSVAELERREGVPVPQEMKELLWVTDGVVVRDWTLLGVRDLHTIEINGREYWQVAVGTGPDHDHRCLHSGEGLVFVTAHDAGPHGIRDVERSLRDWLAALLTGHTDSP